MEKSFQFYRYSCNFFYHPGQMPSHFSSFSIEDTGLWDFPRPFWLLLKKNPTFGGSDKSEICLSQVCYRGECVVG